MAICSKLRQICSDMQHPPIVDSQRKRWLLRIQAEFPSDLALAPLILAAAHVCDILIPQKFSKQQRCHVPRGMSISSQDRQSSKPNHQNFPIKEELGRYTVLGQIYGQPQTPEQQRSPVTEPTHQPMKC